MEKKLEQMARKKASMIHKTSAELEQEHEESKVNFR
jgi:hypothetical protein